MARKEHRALGLMAAYRRARIADVGKEVLREGRVSEELFNVPAGLPTDWDYVQATALVLIIQMENPESRGDIYRIAAEALPQFTPKRAAEVAEICIRWGARVAQDGKEEA